MLASRALDAYLDLKICGGNDAVLVVYLRDVDLAEMLVLSHADAVVQPPTYPSLSFLCIRDPYPSVAVAACYWMNHGRVVADVYGDRQTYLKS